MLKNATSTLHFVVWLTVISLTGCVTPPTIDKNSFNAPKSVTIVDIPKLRNIAKIGVIVPHAPGFPQLHFSERVHEFFEVAKDDSIAPLKNSSASGGLIGAIIMANADQTQNKADLEFNGEILKQFPDYDLRSDFMQALQNALKTRGIKPTLANFGNNKPPRLLWPAQDAEGNKYPSGSLESSTPVESDILLQVSPIAFYNSPGPLNAYYRNVTVGIALYNGKTKQFMGRQTIRFKPNDSALEYHTYSGLVEDIPKAAPALREALLSLVPQIVDIVAGRPAH